MSEPFADQQSPTSIRIARRLTVVLVIILTVNIGLAALAVYAPHPLIQVAPVASPPTASGLELPEELGGSETPSPETVSSNPAPPLSSQAAVESGTTAQVED